MPSAEVFYREYMCKSKPVIITDLFAGEQIREIADREAAIARFGEVPIMVRDEYSKALVEGTGAATRTLSYADYYRHVDANRDTSLMAIEFKTPEKIASQYKVPPVCESQDGESEVFVNQCFIGNAGNRAQIHFDKAGLHGFLYQVFGRKRYFWFPHSASHKLIPMTQVGGWNLHNFTDADRRGFLEFTGGAEAIIDAGDCMYVPTLSWHAVDYLDDSMSISLRFRRADRITRLLNAAFPDMYMQGIAEAMADPADEARWGWALAEIEKANAARGDDGAEHVIRMRNLTRAIHAMLYPDMGRERYAIDTEEYLPDLLPHFRDADHPHRPSYI
ncbi:MAG: cupin-like domain-containing protein [Proteobacteria bacterium]|nr:cupin-like domain-containing protein [Pseudomonadota bacterium]